MKNVYFIDYLNPVLPVYEHTSIPTNSFAYVTDSGEKISGKDLTYKAVDGGVMIMGDDMLVGDVGAYRVRISHGNTADYIIVIAIPEGTTDCFFEAPIFEYDFCGKDFEEISRYWVLQSRSHTLATFNPPAAPQPSATESKTRGFVPFVADYLDDQQQRKHNSVNHKKSIADVGFMYLKKDNIPCLLSDYNVYLDGTLINTAVNIPSDNMPSANAAAGIVGRLSLSCDGVIDHNSEFQATLSTIKNHPAYKDNGKYAHRNFYLSEQLFMPWSYNSQSSEYYGADNSDINIGDGFSLYAAFNKNGIMTGIKKGAMDVPENYSVRKITPDCFYMAGNVNFLLQQEKTRYVCSENGICVQKRGSVGFAFNGVETAINKFKVTYTVDTHSVISGTRHNEKIEKTTNIPQGSIPVRTTQKLLNASGGTYGKKDDKGNPSIKFAVMADQHYDNELYNNKSITYAQRRNNFAKALNKSDIEFVLMTGDNVQWARDYNTINLIGDQGNLKTLYNILSNIPNKDVFAIQGNHDHCTTDYPDRFVLKTEAATFICFSGDYVEFNFSNDKHYIPSAGKITKEMLNWIRAECEKALKSNENEALIFANHFSVQNNEAKFPGNMRDDGCYELADIQMETLRRNELLDIITQYGVQLYINGHEHLNKMNFEEITYQNGYKTGCINYSVGLNPVDCEINGNSVKFKQYDYSVFDTLPEKLEDCVSDSVTFTLCDKKSNRLKGAKEFYSALEQLKKLFPDRFEGLYRYSFQHSGTKTENGKTYYGFKVYYLRYYIHRAKVPVTVYAFPDSEKTNRDLKTYITDIYISADGETL